MSRPTRPGLGGSQRSSKKGGCLGIFGKVVFVFLAISFVSTVMPYLVNPLFAPGIARRDEPDAKNAAAGDTTTIEATTTASILRQKLAVAKEEQRRFLASCDATLKLFGDWEREFAGWEAEGPPLLRNDAGKRIAGDPEQARRFRGLLREGKPSREEFEEGRRSVEEMAAPIRDAAKNPSDASPPDSALDASLNRWATIAGERRDTFREARAAVRGILARAKANPPSEKTLEEAIAAIDEQEAGERAARIDAARKKAEDEGAERVAAEKARLIEEGAKAEAARIANETALKKQAVALANAQAAHELELKEKEANNQRVMREAEAEKKRQGDLKTGSVWIGTSQGKYGSGKMTLSVGGRTKDEIQASVKIKGLGYNEGYVMRGKLSGNRLKLSQGEGGSSLEGVYDAAAKSITGMHLDIFGVQNGSFRIQLSDGTEE